MAVVSFRADQETDGVYELFVAFDDEYTPISFSRDASAALESSGTVSVSVRLDQAAVLLTTVDLVVSGTAQDTDFTLSTTSLTFQPGEVEKALTVSLFDDEVIEDNETVVLALANPTNSAVAAPDTFTLTIEDNEALPPGNFPVYLPALLREAG